MTKKPYAPPKLTEVSLHELPPRIRQIVLERMDTKLIPAKGMAASHAVYVLTTGGTMEKVYSERNGSVANVDSKIGRYLELLRLPDCQLNVVPVMNKDSLEMTEQDRVLILGMVRAILKENASIVITHGTDTMVETGMYLQRALPDVSMPIVLTGAMAPLGFENSDGLQNLTESLLAVQLLPPGVYIVMHNRVHPADRVRKDRALGRFVWTDEQELH